MLATRLEQRNGFRRLLLLPTALVLSSLPFPFFRPSVKGASFLWGKKCDGMQAGDVFLFLGLFSPLSLFFLRFFFFLSFSSFLFLTHVWKTPFQVKGEVGFTVYTAGAVGQLQCTDRLCMRT